MTLSAADIMQVRSATGWGVMGIKSFLETADPKLRERVIVAANYLNSKVDRKDYETLEDPLIRDPEFGPIIRKISEEESIRIRSENDGDWPLGSCHRIWMRTKSQLLREHQLVWFSPHELNPFCAFD